MSNESYNKVRGVVHPDLRGNKKCVLLQIADRVDENFICYPGIRRIARDLGKSKSTIHSAIKFLKEKEWISVFNDKGLTSYYLLNIKKIDESLALIRVDKRKADILAKCVPNIDEAQNDIQTNSVPAAGTVVYQKLVQNPQANPHKEQLQRVVVDKLKSLGIKDHVIKTWIKKFGVEKIQIALDVRAAYPKEVKSEFHYLKAALERNWKPPVKNKPNVLSDEVQTQQLLASFDKRNKSLEMPKHFKDIVSRLTNKHKQVVSR